jgi:hypothetical protein
MGLNLAFKGLRQTVSFAVSLQLPLTTAWSGIYVTKRGCIAWFATPLNDGITDNEIN